jgi:GNAT superfamily N-acetyltransferase
MVFMDGRSRERARSDTGGAGDFVIVRECQWGGRDTIDHELLRAHYEEVAALKSAFKLNPDWNRYDQLHREGKLGFIAAYDGLAGLGMVGYLAFIVEPHMHYKDTMTAIGDVHYVLPEWRRRGVGVRLIRKAESVAKMRGAKWFVLREKIDHRHGDLYQVMGYKPIDIVHLKELK